MIRILKQISARERIMLAAFIIICLLVWGSMLWDRWDATGLRLDAAQRETRIQETWLGNESFLQTQLDRSLARFEMNKMLSEAGLTALVDRYSRENDLRHDLSQASVESGRLFTTATLRVNFRNATLDELARFYLFLENQFPYVTLEGVALVPNRADLRLLNARMRLSAIQIHP
jgi:hypothetical protein